MSPAAAVASSATRAEMLALYRRVLRAHRHLPSADMRALGDRYVHDEFRRHRSVADARWLAGFAAQWRAYAAELECQAAGPDGRVQGRALDSKTLNKMSDQQIGQLWELKKEAQKSLEP